MLHQLRAEGVLGDLSRLQGLLAVAKRYVITDSGWNLLDFAAQARGLTGGNITFRTLPIKGYGVIGGQDVNIVNPSRIKAIVHAVFYPAPGRRHGGHRARPVPAAATTVDVYNGGSTAGLAGRVSAAFATAGYRAGQVGNISYRTSTAVLYGHGAAANAGKIAAAFGVTAAASTTVPAGHVEILLGASAVVPAVSASARPHPRPAVIPTAGPQGGAVHATTGIPCVN